MITREEYFMGRDKLYADELTEALLINVSNLLRKVNKLICMYSDTTGYKPPGVRSGWRPISVNTKVGGAKGSKHITCQAIDLSDTDRKVSDWCLKNLSLLEECGLYMESPEHTPTWTHLQTVAPKSGNRVFIP